MTTFETIAWQWWAPFDMPGRWSRTHLIRPEDAWRRSRSAAARTLCGTRVPSDDAVFDMLATAPRRCRRCAKLAARLDNA